MISTVVYGTHVVHSRCRTRAGLEGGQRKGHLPVGDKLLEFRVRSLFLYSAAVNRLSKKGFTPRIDPTDQTDHDLDHLFLHLPLWVVAEDLQSTDQTQETCAT